jgi:hypothetical protein
MNRVIRSDKPVTVLLLFWSHKCVIGAEPRRRITATSAVKGLITNIHNDASSKLMFKIKTPAKLLVLTVWQDGPCTAKAEGCFPWDFIHQGEFLGQSIFSAWLWPPGDARQFAMEPVSCDSSIYMGLPIKNPMFDRACLHMRCGYLGIMLGLVRRPLGKSSILSSISTFVQDGFWRPTFEWAEHKPQSFSALLQQYDFYTFHTFFLLSCILLFVV